MIFNYRSDDINLSWNLIEIRGKRLGQFWKMLDGEKFGRTKIILKGIHFYETLKEYSGVVSEPMTELIVSFIPFKYMATIYIIITV